MPQATEAFGDVTVIDGEAVVIEKLALDTSLSVSVPRRAVTRTRALEVLDPLGVQTQLVAEDGSPTHPAMFVNELPPFRDHATSNDAAPVAFQRTVVGTFTNTRSPPFGARTVTASGTATMLTLIVARLLSRLPSLALNVKLSAPVAFAFGV